MSNRVPYKQILPRSNAEAFEKVPRPAQWFCESQCNCGKPYSSQKGLKAHLEREENKRCKTYQCSECLNVFGTSTLLTAHMYSHKPNSEKPYSCDVCEFRATRNSDLRRHYNSSFGKCYPATTSSSNGASDAAWYKQNFRCEGCQFGSNDKSKYTRHRGTQKCRKERGLSDAMAAPSVETGDGAFISVDTLDFSEGSRQIAVQDPTQEVSRTPVAVEQYDQYVDSLWDAPDYSNYGSGAANATIRSEPDQSTEQASGFQNYYVPQNRPPYLHDSAQRIARFDAGGGYAMVGEGSVGSPGFPPGAYDSLQQQPQVASFADNRTSTSIGSAVLWGARQSSGRRGYH